MKAITVTFVITVNLFVASLLLSGCFKDKNGNTKMLTPMPGPIPEEITAEMQVKRGEYLVNSVGCDDCHTPKIFKPNGEMELDFSRRLSGHPADEALPEIVDKSILKDYMVFTPSFTSGAGPWGTSFSANLTPDQTGIGNWTEENFLKAIKEGKLKGLDGSRPLLPPMPWFVYKNMTDEDLKAIFAYLKSLPPVKNIVPAPLPPALEAPLTSLTHDPSKQ